MSSNDRVKNGANKPPNYGSVPQTDPDDAELSKKASSSELESPHHHSLLGIFFIILGSFSFSCMFLLVKFMGPDTNTFTLVLYRSLVQIIISFFTLLHQGLNPLGPPCWNTRFWLVIRGFTGSLAVAAFFFGIQILPLPDAVTLQFTTPPFAAVFAVCLVGEDWLPLDMIGAVVCLTGVALIAHPTWLFGPAAAEQDDTANYSAVMKALAVLVTEFGAAMAGIAYVSVRRIGDRASAIVMVLYYGLLSIPICVIGSGLMLGEWNVWADSEFGLREYMILIAMGLGGYGGQWFTNLGLQRETAATATLGTTTQIVWTYIFELIFLHEGVNGWSMGGTGLIVGYMLVVAALKMLPSGDEGELENHLLSEVHGGEEITGITASESRQSLRAMEAAALQQEGEEAVQLVV